MTNDRLVEEGLNAAFGPGLTVDQRAWLDGRVSRAIESRVAPRARYWRLTGGVALVAALLILAPSIFVVAAGLRSTEAPYGTGDAAAYDAELRAAKAVTPLPPGATWPPYLDRADDRSASYGTGLGTQMVEINAYCLWLGYWYEAQQAGDRPAVAAALSGLQSTRSWKTFADPLLSDEGFRAIHADTIDAAAAGDAASVLQQLEWNCDGTWPNVP
jgi:hypothetical protein